VTVDGRHLLRVGPARALPGPVAERLRESRRVDHGALQLGHEAGGRAREPRLGCRLPQHLEPGVAHCLLHDQLALEARGLLLAVAGPLGDRREQTLEAQHPRPEHGSPLRQLPLGVLDVAKGGHHEDRLLVEPLSQPPQHLPRLGRVGGARDQRQRQSAPRSAALASASA
jgi:hypothetical protein